MKLIVLACLATLALASPQFGRTRTPFRPRAQFNRPAAQFIPPASQFSAPPPQRTSPVIHTAARPIAILRDDRNDLGDGNFNYNFETENGISVSSQGNTGSGGQTNIQGSYRFPLPEGGFAEVTYYADETGFHAQSPLLPQAHPLPAHAIEQIRVAEEQRRRGITWE